MALEYHQLLVYVSYCLMGVFNFNPGGGNNFINFGCNGIIFNGPPQKLTHKNAKDSNQVDERRSRIYGSSGGGNKEHVVRISLIGDFKTPHCAGTIHNALYIITAAHCVHDVEPSKILVNAGQYALDIRAQQNRSVVSIEIHENWDFKTFSNDLALLKLNDSLVLAVNDVSPVLLGHPNVFNATESHSYITGWGLTHTTWGGINKTFYSYSYKQLTALIVDLEICKNIYHKLGKKVNNNEICAGGEVGSGPCNGDDGAPLSVWVKNKYGLYKVFVVGILSRYELSCGTGVPEIYLELENYKTWIESKAGRSCDFNVHAHDNHQALKQSYQKVLHKPKGRIEERLGEAICASYNQFLHTSNIQGPLDSPKTVRNYAYFNPNSCSNWQWNTCPIENCQKFERVQCQHKVRDLNKLKRIRQTTTRIMGGQDAQQNQYPYIVRISITDDDFVQPTACNGVIYNSLYVITSAECVHKQLACKLTAIAGDHSVTVEEETEQIRRVVAIIVHENYERQNFYINDIALLKLESPFNFTNYVYPAVLATKDYPTSEVKIVEVSGWGALNSLNDRPDVLQTVQLPFLDDCNCRLAYSFVDGSALNANKFCAGGDGFGLCKDEYGNPFTVTDEGNKYVVGIASFSSVCGFHPGVGTKLSAYREWIEIRAG